MRFFRRPAFVAPAGRQNILVVCTANVCRSPMAEAALRKKLWQAGLDFDVDSAGTHESMAGMPPFTLAVATAKRRGYNITGIVARRVRPHDFRYFGLILATSRENLEWLKMRAPRDRQHKVKLLTEFSRRFPWHDIPDPYGGGVAGYELALEMIEDACDGLVRSFRTADRQESEALALRSA